jgi:hypothetical protein
VVYHTHMHIYVHVVRKYEIKESRCERKENDKENEIKHTMYMNAHHI